MKHFTIPELTYSTTAHRLGIDNLPSPAAMRNLMLLTDKVLDPVRELWGRPLVVTSGYRCTELNRQVGGVNGSQHLTGLAADLVTLGCNKLSNYRLYEMIKASAIPFDQLIAEGRNGNTCAWVHVSWSAAPRRQAL